MDSVVNRAARAVVNWTSRYHVAIVIVLSVLHVGIAIAMHARESGRAGEAQEGT